MPGLPLIAVPHPLAGNDAALVGAKAAAVADEVRRVLADAAATLAAEYRTRFTTLTERRLAGGAVCIDESCALDVAMTEPR